MTNPSLETERLHLITTTLDHAPYILKVMNTEEWIRFVGDRNLHSEEDARNYIKNRMLPQLEKHGHTNFIIREKASQKILGLCGIYVRDGLETPDLGFALLPEYYRKGYGYEAAMGLLEFGFSELKLPKILAITHPDNKASQSLLLKLNFQFTEEFKLPGEEQTLFKFQIINPSI